MTLRATLIQSAIDLVTRLILEARSDRDAEAIVHQLRALGQVPRADVDAIEAAAREALSGFASRSDEKRRAVMRGEPLPTFDDAVASQGGPLDEGD